MTQKPHPKLWKLQSFINFPALLCFEILQMLETSLVHILSGHLNVEWAVRPSSKSYAGRSHSKGNFFYQILYFFTFIRNILPVPPGASKKYFSFITIN